MRIPSKQPLHRKVTNLFFTIKIAFAQIKKSHGTSPFSPLMPKKRLILLLKEGNPTGVEDLLLFVEGLEAQGPRCI